MHEFPTAPTEDQDPDDTFLRLPSYVYMTLESAVTARLRQLVMGGEFAPGFHLQEIPLAALLQASRTPVRAALATLAQEGLVVGRAKRGYTVRQVSLKEVLDAYRVRGVLEALACRILAENGVPDDIAATLDACVETGAGILSAGTLEAADPTAWRANNERLHRTLMHATGNAPLIDAITRTSGLPLVSSWVVQWSDYEEIRTAQYHHRTIVAAIRCGQASRAAALMSEHVHVASERLRRHFP